MSCRQPSVIPSKSPCSENPTARPSGVVIDSLPAGEPIDLGELEAFLARRAPGGRYASQRKERDIPHILSGLVDGVTCGSPLCAVFENGDTQSQEYLKNRFLPRPGHGDYPNFIRHEGYSDVRGGGHSSARLTAPLALAGGIAKQLLAAGHPGPSPALVSGWGEGHPP